MDVMLPAAGQGALALQCRRSDPDTVKLLDALNDPATAACVAAERKLVQVLNGDCHSPIAALATIREGVLEVRAAVGARGGVPPVVLASGRAGQQEPEKAVAAVFQSLLDQGAVAMLAGDV